MNQTLKDAPYDRPLMVMAVAVRDLSLRLARLGLNEGVVCTKLDEDLGVHPVRVRGPKGEAVLSGLMASGVQVHLDAGDKKPLLELNSGQSGHVEGLTVNPQLARAFGVLGLKENDRITLVRELPPMEYLTLIEGRERVRLVEGAAAKIWGSIQGRMMQFANASVDEAFLVSDILGGDRVQNYLGLQGIQPGKTILLEGVEPSRFLCLDRENPVIVTTSEGLRLSFHPRAAQKVLVREITI